MSTNLNSIWRDEENIARLTALWNTGQTATAIGRELGVSRNAIMGKAYRLGLLGGRSTIPLPADRGSRKRKRSSKKAEAKMNGKHQGPEATEIAPEIVVEPVAFLDLREHHCRWPVSGIGYEMLYCGATKANGFSYCGKHCKRAFAGREPRRPASEIKTEAKVLLRG